MATVFSASTLFAAAAISAGTATAATFTISGGDIASIIKELVPLVSAGGIIFTAWVAWKTKESVKEVKNEVVVVSDTVKVVDAKATMSTEKLAKVELQTDGISKALMARGDDATAKLLDLTKAASEAEGKEKARVAILESNNVTPAAAPVVAEAAKEGAKEAIEGMTGEIRAVDAEGKVGKVEGSLTGKVGGKGIKGDQQNET